ncbi:MAG: tRNA (adenosine(37)-N6)-threonylcarbamoyltransferase complex dimerization subunit type 1 TsaB [Clostridiales bacterium]|nr:tRNA (adenosine(37)-N6)-threonylcarbamoyltransferase complex dimerization subunit type 1 TsaB [Clostridiales bacterium]
MTILALDTSAGPASCAVSEEGQIVASAAVNVRLTHSQTLMPMVEGMLKNAGLTLEDIDLMAVSVGPGSFTGIRIGVSALKGLAFPRTTPCAGVSTLAAIARNLEGTAIGEESIVCPVMDARCCQVYTALFATNCEGGLTRLTADGALTLEELEARLTSLKKNVFLVGDGAELCYNTLKDKLPCRLAPPHLRYQQAAGVAMEAVGLAAAGQTVPAEELMPVYLRLPQAERERLAAVQAQGS